MLNSTLDMFTVTSTAIGLTAFCIPIKKPLKTLRESVAGAAHILIKKYSLAKASTCGEHSMK
jgi:hypothetical protein